MRMFFKQSQKSVHSKSCLDHAISL